MIIKKHVILAIAGVILLLSLIVFTPAPLLLDKKFYSIYSVEELVLESMSKKITRNIKGKHEKAIRLFDYVREHMYAVGSPGDNKPFSELVRNIGWCDQQARIHGRLAKRVGIKSKWVRLFGYDKVSHHSVGLLRLSDEYRMFDPWKNVYFYTEKNSIATLENIQESKSSLRSSFFEALKKYSKEDITEYFRLYSTDYPWKIHEIDSPNGFRAALVLFWYRLYEEPFLNFFINNYFIEADVDPYLKARMLHLIFDYERAIQVYDQILLSKKSFRSKALDFDYKEVTKEVIDSEALFFKGQAYWDMKDYEKTIAVFQDWLKRYPSSRWSTLANYYLGDSYEKLNHKKMAMSYYRKIKDNSQTPAPERLMRLESANVQSLN